MRNSVWLRPARYLPAVLPLLMAACHSASAPTPENLTKGISKYLADHPDCLYKTALRFPYETSAKPEIAQLNALVGAKLLDRGTEPAIHVDRYTVTDYGTKSAPRFCYGYRHVTGIESSTPPAKAADGFSESEVAYRYEMRDVPVWARAAEVEKAYPEMAHRVAGSNTAKITLAQTAVGWQVPQ